MTSAVTTHGVGTGGVGTGPIGPNLPRSLQSLRDQSCGSTGSSGGCRRPSLARPDDPALQTPARLPSPEDGLLPAEPVVLPSPGTSGRPVSRDHRGVQSLQERISAALLDETLVVQPDRIGDIDDDIALEVLSQRIISLVLRERPTEVESGRTDPTPRPERSQLVAPTILWLAAGLKALVLGPWSTGARTRNSVSQDDHAEKPAE